MEAPSRPSASVELLYFQQIYKSLIINKLDAMTKSCANSRIFKKLREFGSPEALFPTIFPQNL